MIKPAIKKNLFEEVSEQIIELIKSGEWNPGDKIPGEMVLSESFRVSRNSIRESLKALELTGILSSKAGRGTFVSERAVRNIRNRELASLIEDESSLVELMETRLMIEPELAYLAAKRATPEDIEKLENSIRVSKQALTDHEYTIEMGMEFHTLIREASQNRILGNFMKSISEHLMAQRATAMLKYLDNYVINVEWNEHMQMLEYIKDGEGELIKKYMYDHISKSLQLIVNGEKKSKKA